MLMLRQCSLLSEYTHEFELEVVYTHCGPTEAMFLEANSLDMSTPYGT